MDGLSAEAERLFTRLIMRADDYGRFHGEHRLVKANCFPLADDIKAADIGPWLVDLADRGLIILYEVDGRKTLAIANYGQRLKKSRVKFPPLPGMEPTWLPEFDSFLPLGNDFREVPGSSGKFPPEGNTKGTRTRTEPEPEPDIEGPKKTRATLPEVVSFMSEIELKTADAEYIFHSWESNGWTRNGKPVKDWKAQIRSWKAAKYFPTQKSAMKKDSSMTCDQLGIS
jgi:hypothetical protein